MSVNLSSIIIKILLKTLWTYLRLPSKKIPIKTREKEEQIHNNESVGCDLIQFQEQTFTVGLLGFHPSMHPSFLCKLVAPFDTCCKTLFVDLIEERKMVENGCMHQFRC